MFFYALKSLFEQENRNVTFIKAFSSSIYRLETQMFVKHKQTFVNQIKRSQIVYITFIK